MKKSRLSDAQIIAVLQQQQSSRTLAQIVREHSISETTFYTWKTKCAGLQVSELTRLKHLEAENQRLKQFYAELGLENHATREVLRKKQ